MKTHDLRPAAGSVTKKTRVGRGIAAGKGKTAGRGTKGQRSRAGASIPAWFEGGQTPLHIRIPKLRGFRNINDVEYEVVNVGAISAAIDAGKLESDGTSPVTVNADTLKQAGLVRRDRLPLKVLGAGEVSVKLFVLADAFTRSAREKIETAGGTAQLIEIPTEPLAALGVDAPEAAPARPARAPKADKAGKASAQPVADEPAESDEPQAEAETVAADEATSADAAEATADVAAEAGAEADAPADEADATADNG
jgi:large subunit ribosomal protein L15